MSRISGARPQAVRRTRTLSVLGIAALGALLATCTDDGELLRVDGPETTPQAALVDAAKGGNRFFYWQPPLVSNPKASGAVDATLLPSLSVVVCEWTGSACGATVAAMTSSAGTLSLVDGAFQANWKSTKAGTYRVRVLAASTELGSADVRVVEKGADLRGIDASQYVGVVRNSTLPIKFLALPGAVTVIDPASGGTVRVPDSPITLTIPAGALAGATGITITPIPTSSIPASSTGVPALGAIDLGPDGTVFNSPVTLTMPYDPSLLPPGVPEEDLAIYWVDGSGNWIELPVVLDTATNTLSAQLEHFSKYVTAPVAAKNATAKVDTTGTTQAQKGPPATGDTVTVKFQATSSIPTRPVKGAQFDSPPIDPTQAKVISKTKTSVTLQILKPSELPVSGQVTTYARPGGVTGTITIAPVQNAVAIELADDSATVRVLGGRDSVAYAVYDAVGNTIARAPIAITNNFSQLVFADTARGRIQLTGMLQSGRATLIARVTGRNSIVYSDTLRVGVTKATASLTVTGDTTAYHGEATLTAQFLSGFRKPIEFYVDGVKETTVYTDTATGRATAKFYTSLAPGSHTVVATLPADGQFTTVSDTAKLVIRRVVPRLTIQPITPAEYGGTVNMTVTFGGSYYLGQDVTLNVSGPVLRNIKADSAGTARTSWPASAAPGQLQVTVSFPGNTNFEPVTATAFYTVWPKPLTLTLAAAPTTLAWGESTTLTASLSEALAGQSVTFTKGGSTVGAATTNAQGVATLLLAMTDTGTVSFGASVPASTYYTAASGSTDVTVTRKTPSVAVANLGAVYGSQVTLQASVQPARAGTAVQFSVAGAPVGTASTDAQGNAALPYTVTVPAGAQAVGAAVVADAYFTAASAAGTLTVTRAPQQVSGLDVTAAATTPAKLTAQLTPARAGVTIDFLNGSGTVIGSGQTDANGFATYSYTPTTTGTFTMFVRANQDCCFEQALGQWVLTVTQAPITVTSFPAVSGAYGTFVSGKITISPASNRQVILRLDSSTVTTIMTNSLGVGLYGINLGTRAIGVHTLTAEVVGDATYATVRAATTLTINQVPTSIVPSDITLYYGDPVTFDATLSPGVTGKLLTWTVNGEMVASAVTGTGGTATSTNPPVLLAPGTYNGTAAFAGDAIYTASQASFTFTVVRRSIALTALNDTTVYNGAASLVAQFASPYQGQVTFTVDGTQLGSVYADATGTATLNLAALPTLYTPGAHIIIASSPQTNQINAVADTAMLIVTKAPSVLTVDNITADWGVSTTLRARLTTPANAGAPITITFNGTSQTVNTDASGVATAFFKPQASGTISASFAGNTLYSPATATGTLTLTGITPVIDAPATLSYTYGTITPITATVAQAPANALIEFWWGATKLGAVVADASGNATLNLSQQLFGGTFMVVAKFLGAPGYNPASDSTQVTVLPMQDGISIDSMNVAPDVSFTMTARSLRPGVTVNFRIGGTSLGSAVANASGIATRTVSGRAPGNYMYVASISPSTTNTGASAIAPLIVRKRSTFMNAGSFAIDVGQSATLSAYVGGSAGNLSGATIRFVRASDNSTIATVTADANGAATYVITGLPVGQFDYRVVYDGDALNEASSANGMVIVRQPTTMTLTGPTSTLEGTRKDWVATLSPAAAGKTVNLYLDGQLIASAVTDAAGNAYFDEIRLWGTGVRRELSARFDGDAFYGASAAMLEVTVQ